MAFLEFDCVSLCYFSVLLCFCCFSCCRDQSLMGPSAAKLKYALVAFGMVPNEAMHFFASKITMPLPTAEPVECVPTHVFKFKVKNKKCSVDS